MASAETQEMANGETIRSAEQIARRALALFAVVGVGLGTPRDQVTSWLRDEGLWAELSPSERMLFEGDDLTEKQTMNASWRSEALLVLTWALQKIETLPPPNEQCDTALFQQYLPPFADISVTEFVTSATRRDDRDLLSTAAAIQQMHWEARDAALHGRNAAHLDIEIIQEWHHAINWVCGYDDLPWDEITTDT
jgi:hypothetical protein